MAKKDSICLNCNEEFIYESRQSGGLYCSNKCSGEHKQNKNIQEWLDGKHTGGSGYNLSNFVRVYLFRKYNSKCCKCGWCEKNPVSGKIPLQINHIDGDSRNHKEENLELLCPNCHSLTDTYGILNKGSGRYSLKELHPSKRVKKERIETKCLECGEIFIHSISNDRKYCSNECNFKSKRTVDRPSLEQLENDIEELGYCGTGRKYGVSDNAIRKWIK